MIAVDAGILAYAANRYAPEHARAVQVLESLANDPSPWALPWSEAHAFVRLATHPHAVAKPLSPAEAWGFVARLSDSPSLRLLAPAEGHATAVAECARAAAGGAGLELAATLREHGVRELLSADPGMRRWAFLTVTDPLHGEPWTPASTPVRQRRVLPARS